MNGSFLIQIKYAKCRSIFINKEPVKVQLVGFGTFETVKRAAREGRNPQTGAVVKIKASRSPKFKAGKALKDFVKG